MGFINQKNITGRGPPFQEYTPKCCWAPCEMLGYKNWTTVLRDQTEIETRRHMTSNGGIGIGPLPSDHLE